MYAKCREYLIDRLRASGIQMEPITSLKKLQLYRNSHVGAVLFDEETLERDGSRRVFKDTDGNPKTRTCLFKRNVVFDVVIGEFNAEKLDAIYQRFLEILGKGLYINGDFVYVEPSEAEWAEDEDSILAAKIAVKIRVTFSGGVYVDTPRQSLKDKELDIDHGQK